MSSISAKWRELAINLGLKPSDVESIAHNFSNDRDCLSEVLKYWLQLNFNYQRNGLPSWRTLALAVYKIKVDLFHRIAGMYQSKRTAIYMFEACTLSYYPIISWRWKSCSWVCNNFKWSGFCQEAGNCPTCG